MNDILILSSLTKYTTALPIIRAAKKNYNLFIYSDSKSRYADKVGPGIIDISILLKKIKFNPDLLLFIEGGTMELFPVGLEKLQCLTAWYAIDTHMDYKKHFIFSKLFDITFIAQYEFVDRLKRDGIRQVFWLPLAFDSSLATVDHNYWRKIDISYVGSMEKSINPKRHNLLSKLSKIFPNHCFGPASSRELYRIYSKSKIVFNYSVKNDINMRFFEAMGNGAVLLTNQIKKNGLDLLFQEGREYLEYEDDNTLIKKARHLLDNDLLREDISRNAKKAILEKHTYEHRVKQIINIATNCKKIQSYSPGDYLNAFISSRHITGMLWLFQNCLEMFKLHPKLHPAKLFFVTFFKKIILFWCKSIETFYKLRNR